MVKRLNTLSNRVSSTRLSLGSEFAEVAFEYPDEDVGYSNATFYGKRSAAAPVTAKTSSRPANRTISATTTTTTTTTTRKVVTKHLNNCTLILLNIYLLAYKSKCNYEDFVDTLSHYDCLQNNFSVKSNCSNCKVKSRLRA